MLSSSLPSFCFPYLHYSILVQIWSSFAHAPRKSKTAHVIIIITKLLLSERAHSFFHSWMFLLPVCHWFVDPHLRSLPSRWHRHAEWIHDMIWSASPWALLLFTTSPKYLYISNHLLLTSNQSILLCGQQLPPVGFPFRGIKLSASR